jgi:hypothetical protein
VRAEVSANAHGAEKGAHFIPWAGAFGIKETALAFFDQKIAEKGGRVAQDAPHVFAEKDEDAAVEKTLGEADQLAARASEVWICLNESVIDELAIVAVFAVEIFFDVGAGTKLDRDGSKLDSRDGAKLDFLERAAEVTGLEWILMED